MISKEDLKIYFNWSCNQLAGDPVATDKYLRDHLEVVKKVSANLLHDMGYYPKPIYRGVVILEGGLTELKPHKGFTYLSFSEDKKVAEIFADPSHDMAFMLRKRLGSNNLHGYITEYTPRLEEVLFHHSFLEIFPYVEALYHKRNIDASAIHEQKEVTILQPNRSLILNQYENRNNYQRRPL